MKTETLPGIEYLPYDDSTQAVWKIDQYPKSYTRTPSNPLVKRPLTLSELTGPTELERRLKIGDGEDLSHAVPGGTRAIGQFIRVSGRVTDEDGSPVAGAVIELWQANSAGKYVHELDRNDAPVDPNFLGIGRLVTDQEGCYKFFSIKPGGYPVGEGNWWWRPPHIHFSIFGVSWMSRFVTQIYFPGEPLNQTDLLLNAVRDEEARQRVIFQPEPTVILPSNNVLGFQRDFVLRGKHSTPELG